MKLRELVHEGVDALDNRSLVLVYEQVQLLLPKKADKQDQKPIPTADELADRLKHDKSCWADEVIAERDERL